MNEPLNQVRRKLSAPKCLGRETPPDGKSSVATAPPKCYKQESKNTMATSPLFGLLGNFAGPDMLIIFIVILLLFGAKKLPELARGMGQAVKEFSKAKDSLHDELNRPVVTDTSHSYHADPHHADSHHSSATPATNVAPTASATSAPSANGSDSAPKPNA